LVASHNDQSGFLHIHFTAPGPSIGAAAYNGSALKQKLWRRLSLILAALPLPFASVLVEQKSLFS
jgi:hypothetical protein